MALHNKLANLRFESMEDAIDGLELLPSGSEISGGAPMEERRQLGQTKLEQTLIRFANMTDSDSPISVKARRKLQRDALRRRRARALQGAGAGAGPGAGLPDRSR